MQLRSNMLGSGVAVQLIELVSFGLQRHVEKPGPLAAASLLLLVLISHGPLPPMQKLATSVAPFSFESVNSMGNYLCRDVA
ncbi:hypothetical protein HU200_043822 [Digitaria exilis]|uniref:Uncharacterized protein n=1 Tax=Digitaria exilis TaxID=1010633 RepID=A0A835B2R4_9POAL|nr:hypothetical protein HU200_043822 [Digitaria exilis]